MQPIKFESVDIGEHVRINDTLCPVVFSSPDTVYDTFKSGIINIANFWWGENRPLVNMQKAVNVVLYGDLAGYVYNRFSPVYVGLVYNNLSEPLQANLSEINDILEATEIPYTFINRRVHCHFLAGVPQGIPCFSIIHQRWVNPPVKRRFTFTMPEFCMVFPRYQQIIRENVESHSRHPNGEFTIEGCHQLEAYLKYLRSEARKDWLDSDEHEYNFDYLLYRTFCELGGERYFKKFLIESYNYNINELEQC